MGSLLALARRACRAGRRPAGALLVLALGACGQQAGPGKDEGASIPVPAGFVEQDGWQTSVAAELGEKLGGCAVGDVDSEHVGEEIVAVAESGAIAVVAYGADGWSQRDAGRTPGEMVQVAVGDVLELVPGLEIVAVGIAAGREDDGGEGAAWLLARTADGWSLREIYRSPALLHAVAIADLHSAPGDEIVVAGFSQEAVLLVREGETFAPAILGTLPGAAKSAVPHQGGFAVGTTDGSVTSFRLVDGQWEQRVLDQAPAGVSRLASDDERLLAARDDGALGLLTGKNRLDVHAEPDKLRGAAIANVDPTARGLELATAGYGGAITVLRAGADPRSWEPVTVFQDSDRLHHLAWGTLGSIGPGVFLVGCGYSGRLIVVRKGN